MDLLYLAPILRSTTMFRVGSVGCHRPPQGLNAKRLLLASLGLRYAWRRVFAMVARYLHTKASKHNHLFGAFYLHHRFVTS